MRKKEKSARKRVTRSQRHRRSRKRKRKTMEHSGTSDDSSELEIVDRATAAAAKHSRSSSESSSEQEEDFGSVFDSSKRRSKKRHKSAVTSDGSPPVTESVSKRYKSLKPEETKSFAPPTMSIPALMRLNLAQLVDHNVLSVTDNAKIAIKMASEPTVMKAMLATFEPTVLDGTSDVPYPSIMSTICTIALPDVKLDWSKADTPITTATATADTTADTTQLSDDE